MIDIKFRAWGRTYGNKEPFMSDPFKLGDICQECGTFNGPSGHYMEDGTVVMQYTGLKDKNEKEIYEGDIVKVIAPNSVVEEERVGVNLKVEDFLSMYKDGNEWIFEAPSSAMEVVGNTYENPELLKEGKI